MSNARERIEAIITAADEARFSKDAPQTSIVVAALAREQAAQIDALATELFKIHERVKRIEAQP